MLHFFPFFLFPFPDSKAEAKGQDHTNEFPTPQSLRMQLDEDVKLILGLQENLWISLGLVTQWMTTGGTQGPTISKPPTHKPKTRSKY